jgi:uncharacterized repeat protein (TIGR01451 family)
LDGSLVEAGGVMDGGSWGEPGCTTCQKTPELVMGDESADDGAIVEGSPFDGEQIVEGTEPLMLPAPDGSEPAYSVNPTPEEQPVKPEATKPEQPTKPIEVAPPGPRTTVAKPSALNLDVRSSVPTATAGQEVSFDIVLANVGGSSVESIEVVATLADGLRPKSVSPNGVSRIEGQRIIFDSIKSLAPMTLSYTIVAEALPGMAESKLTVEVSSPILTSGPIKQERVVRINP